MLKRAQRAIGLLELMLSLAIISILLLMATRYFYIVDQGQKVDKAVDMSLAIKTAGQHWLLVHNDFSGSTNLLQDFIDRDYLPAAITVNPWGGAVAISAAKDVTSLQITISGINTSRECCNLNAKLTPSFDCSKSCSGGKGAYQYQAIIVSSS